MIRSNRRALIAGFRYLLVVCLVVPVAVACTPTPKVVVSVPSEILYSRLVETGSAVNSLRGFAKFNIKSGEREEHSNQALLLQAPDRFRAETLSMFGPPILTLASNGNEIAVAIPSRGQYYRDEASPQNLSRFIRLPLAGEQLVGLLLGRMPLLKHLYRDADNDEQGRPRLTLSDNNGMSQTVLFSADLVPVSAIYQRGEEIWLRVEFSHYREAPPLVPELLRIEMPVEKVRIEARYREMEYNVVIHPDMFELNPPEGVVEQPLP